MAPNLLLLAIGLSWKVSSCLLGDSDCERILCLFFEQFAL